MSEDRPDDKLEDAKLSDIAGGAAHESPDPYDTSQKCDKCGMCYPGWDFDKYHTYTFDAEGKIHVTSCTVDYNDGTWL